MREPDQLDLLERRILSYIHASGPVFVTKLAKRLAHDAQEVKTAVETLREEGYLERVASTLVDYRLNKRNKVTKHRNHSYFDLSRHARLHIRHGRLAVEDVNARPPWLQA